MSKRASNDTTNAMPIRLCDAANVVIRPPMMMHGDIARRVVLPLENVALVRRVDPDLARHYSLTMSKVSTSVNLPAWMRQMLKEVAEEKGLSVNALINAVLVAHYAPAPAQDMAKTA